MSEFLDIKQVTTILNVKESWLRSVIYQKKIKIIKMGGLVRISRKDLEEFVSQCSAKSAKATRN